MSTIRPISVLIAEDESIIRLGLTCSLQPFTDIKVVGTSADGRAAVCDAVELKPDVILMDIGLPLIDGITASQQIKAVMPGVRIIMFTASGDEATINAALGAGADGYCFKDCSPAHLYSAIKAVAGGVAWLAPGIADLILRNRPAITPSDNSLAGTEKNLVDASLIALPSLASASSRPSTSALEKGSLLGDRYLIDSTLGRGGMGIVYKATHLLMDRPVAIKMLHSHHLADASIVKRFQTEARSLSLLTHPNLVTAFDFGMTQLNEPYMVMDFHDGKGLDEILQTYSKITFGRAVNIFSQICDALTAVHECGIVHRDIKPSNILISEAGLVKLVDFGIAKSIQSMTSNLTLAGQVMGTPRYMSPEQYMGKELDSRSDIYALGCVMYEVFTGKPPFSATGYFELVRQHVEDLPSHEPFAPLIDFSPALEEIIFKCLEKDPDFRYQSAEQLNYQLANIGSS